MNNLTSSVAMNKMKKKRKQATDALTAKQHRKLKAKKHLLAAMHLKTGKR